MTNPKISTNPSSAVAAPREDWRSDMPDMSIAQLRALYDAFHAAYYGMLGICNMPRSGDNVDILGWELDRLYHSKHACVEEMQKRKPKSECEARDRLAVLMDWYLDDGDADIVDVLATMLDGLGLHRTH